MKILGAGLSKTGTTSLARALNILGYSTLDCDRERLNDVIHGVDDDPSFRIYDDLDAVTDLPSAHFYREFLDAYPSTSLGESMMIDAVDARLLESTARDVAYQFGVQAEDVVPVPVHGQVNFTAYLGSELVVRIPRTSRAAEQLAKEARVIGLVRDAGIPTPELLCHDDTLRLAALPYMVQQRARGATLAEQSLDPVTLRRVHESLGQVLTSLHQIHRDETGPIDSVPEPYTFSLSELVRELLEAGEIGTPQRDWLLESFELLEPNGPTSADPVLLHRDVIPSNIMINRNGAVTALLDWGCAEWGNPARDLVGLRIGALPDVVSGYRSMGSTATAADSEHTLERDALWYYRYLALARLLKRPSTSEDRNWAAPRSASLVDFLEFACSADAEPWSTLLRPVGLGGAS